MRASSERNCYEDPLPWNPPATRLPSPSCEDGRTVLTDCIASQVALHRLYGGVVPELASRKHIEAIYALADEALDAGAT